jgi:hypothetical protein
MVFASLTFIADLVLYAVFFTGCFISCISIHSSICPTFVVCTMFITMAERQLELSAGASIQGANQTEFP